MRVPAQVCRWTPGELSVVSGEVKVSGEPRWVAVCG